MRYWTKMAKGFLFIMLIGGGCLLVIWQFSTVRRIPPINISPSVIQSGDILFINGKSWRSQIVRILDLEQREYTHAGIICKTGDSLSVVHATPNYKNGAGKVIEEPLGEFITAKDISYWKLFRVEGLTPEIRIKAGKFAKDLAQSDIPFDHEFDNSTTHQLYCTELIVYIFDSLQVPLREAIEKDRIIFPSQIINHPKVNPVGI